MPCLPCIAYLNRFLAFFRRRSPRGSPPSPQGGHPPPPPLPVITEAEPPADPPLVDPTGVADVEALGAELAKHVDQLEALIRSRTGSPTCELVEGPIAGSYNVAFVFKLDDQRVVLRVPGPGDLDSIAFEQDIRLLDRIGAQTDMPVPRPLAWSSSRQEIGFPYSITTFLPGTSLSSLWQTMRLDQRHGVIRELAGQMFKLKRFAYPSIGQLVFDKTAGDFIVQPLVRRTTETDETLSESVLAALTAPAGPFSRVSNYHDWLIQRMRQVSASDPWPFTYRLLCGALNDRSLDESPFVLAHPDLDLQNVLVDPETYSITGILDWDGVSRTLPRAIGYLRFPAWVVRDMDPFLYGYSAVSASEEGNAGVGTASLGPGAHATEAPALGIATNQETGLGIPSGATGTVVEAGTNGSSLWEDIDTLEGYRQIWVDAIHAIEPSSSAIAKQSHLALALNNGLRNTIPRGGIGFKLTKYIFGPAFFNPFDMPLAIRDGRWYMDDQQASI